MNELPQDDLDFLGRLGKDLDEDILSSDEFAELTSIAATGNKLAIDLVEMVEAAVVTEDLFNARLEDLFDQCVVSMERQCPLLDEMCGAVPGFRRQFGRFLDLMMRQAFAWGWLAHEQRDEGK